MSRRFPLCPLWLKPLNSSPSTTDHANRGTLLNAHYFRRTTLAEIKVEIITEACQRNLITARQVKTELSQREIVPRQRPPVKHHPGFPLLDLVYDFRRRHMNLQGSKALLFPLVRNLCFVRLPAIPDVRPIKIVV